MCHKENHSRVRGIGKGVPRCLSLWGWGAAELENNECSTQVMSKAVSKGDRKWGSHRGRQEPVPGAEWARQKEWDQAPRAHRHHTLSKKGSHMIYRDLTSIWNPHCDCGGENRLRRARWKIWENNFNTDHWSNPSKRWQWLTPASSRWRWLSGRASGILAARFWLHSEEGAGRIPHWQDPLMDGGTYTLRQEDILWAAKTKKQKKVEPWFKAGIRNSCCIRGNPLTDARICF